MHRSLSIRTWLEPFPTEEGVAVAFDVFRCSTTIHTLAHQNRGPVHIAESLLSVRETAEVRGMRVFSELSQPVDCRERRDNSPALALSTPWENQVPALVATTTGTPSMFAARRFKKVYVGSLVNFSALVRHLTELGESVTLIPAAIPEWQHVEDEITAFAMATALEGFSTLPDFVRQCAEQARERILASGRIEHLTNKLSTGAEDTAIATDIDRFDQVLSLEFTAASPLFARVVREK